MSGQALQPRQMELEAEVARLRQTVRLMEQQRERILGRRRRRLLMLGASVSLLCHIMLMTYLAMVHRGGGGGGGTAVAYQLAILNEEELTDEVEPASFEELPIGPDVDHQPLAEMPELDAIAPEIGSSSAAPSEIPGLGASGEGSGGGIGTGQGAGGGLGLGGGGGGTSFFGIGAKGTRFAYIVDVSGSMGQNRKLELALRELAKSIDGLPDFTHFYVLLFSSHFVQPPMQKGWMRARKPVVRQFITWLSDVDPGGGTEPRSAFLQVFSLEVRPDIIFFLTDGQFTDITPEEIAALNGSGKKAIINTIQFGDPSGEDVLRQMARQSGGVYRFVPASEGP